MKSKTFGIIMTIIWLTIGLIGIVILSIPEIRNIISDNPLNRAEMLKAYWKVYLIGMGFLTSNILLYYAITSRRTK